MTYIMLAVCLVALSIGGVVGAGISLAGGIIYIFYLNFAWGPKLTLMTSPVIIGFFICSLWLKDFSLMYAKHMLKYVLICLLIVAIFCRFYFEENYKHIVIAATTGITALTMILLAIWMYAPQQFSVPDKTDTIEIQQMSESQQAVFPGTEDMHALMETLDEMEMHGSFKELTEFSDLRKIYRLTLREQNGKEIATYYFYSPLYMAKQIGKEKLVFYRWNKEVTFPYNTLVEMYDYVVEAADSQQQSAS